ncbi:hypothetical protein ACFY1P_26835 [Streptomyces sp. NPDC001407]|uniref:hypothetical protein n=1 Tax=Streptomyces sp. NPDC001407 TaxID=3364573 RepID=UPI0036C11DFA
MREEEHLLPGAERVRTLAGVTVRYQSQGLPLARYELSRADRRRQEEAESIARWVAEQLAKAPPLGPEQLKTIEALLSSADSSPREYARWRVRLFCGHIAEVERPADQDRPDERLWDKETCSECGLSPAVIVAFEHIGLVCEPSPPPTPPTPPARKKPSRAELELRVAALEKENERLRAENLPN